MSRQILKQNLAEGEKEDNLQEMENKRSSGNNLKRLKSILSEYLSYYHNDRIHLGLSKDIPNHRFIQAGVEGNGKLIALARVGGLHHRYEWQDSA